LNFCSNLSRLLYRTLHDFRSAPIVNLDVTRHQISSDSSDYALADVINFDALAHLAPPVGGVEGEASAFSSAQTFRPVTRDST
jgi:hypothetical protein